MNKFQGYGSQALYTVFFSQMFLLIYYAWPFESISCIYLLNVIKLDVGPDELHIEKGYLFLCQ